MSSHDDAWPRPTGTITGEHEVPCISLTLNARNARDLMTSSPVTIRTEDSLLTAIELFGRGFAALPVLSLDGRLVGVISRNDMLQRVLRDLGTTSESGELDAASASPITRNSMALTRVADAMTPEVFSVSPKTPAITVVTKMLVRKVHQLFVVDDAGALVGVITTIDIMFKLQP